MRPGCRVVARALFAKGNAVDPQLRVNGIDGLRVAEASIMPPIASANTNAPLMTIAEKAGELTLSFR